MRKIIRLIITVVFFPIWFPITAFAYSLFGLVIILGISVFIGDGFLYLFGDEEYKEDYLENLRDGFYMATGCIWCPILGAKQFIIKGHFREL